MLEAAILLHGFPGVGKSTVGPALASATSLPRLSKDTIKEAMWDALPRLRGLAELEWSRELGRASWDVLWRTAGELGPRLIIETPPMGRDWAAPKIRGLTRRPIEIFVFADAELVHERHRSRLPSQHACHLPYPLPTVDEVRSGLQAARPLGLGGPLLELDLSRPCDVAAVASWIRQQL